MMKTLEESLQSSFVENVLILNKDKLDIALTLTLKQGMMHENGMFEALTRQTAEKNVSHFLSKLNYGLYRNSARRHGKRLAVCTMIEGGQRYGSDKRLHVHMAIQFPPMFDIDSDLHHSKFGTMIVDCWSRTRWGHDEMDYQVMYDKAGWLRYITKDGNEGIDLNNTYFGPLHIPGAMDAK